MLRLVLAGACGIAAAVCARRAWREPWAARLRRQRSTPARRVPAALRGPLDRALTEAQLAVTPEEAITVGAVGVLVVAIVTVALSPTLVPAAVALAVVAGPVGLALARGRGQRRFVAALPTFVELVAARLRSGHTVATALQDAASRRDPVAADVARVVRRVELGDPLDAALGWWAADRRLDPLRAVAGSLAVAVETGGAAADALEGLARSLREQLGARADATALSAQARLSALVVGVAPLAYVGFAAAVDPAAAEALVTTTTGRICLVLGLGLDALGALWMRRIVRSEP